jgi:hypothetical protein
VFLSAHIEVVIGGIQKFHVRDRRDFDPCHWAKKPNHKIKAALHNCGSIDNNSRWTSERQIRKQACVQNWVNKAGTTSDVG